LRERVTVLHQLREDSRRPAYAQIRTKPGFLVAIARAPPRGSSWARPGERSTCRRAGQARRCDQIALTTETRTSGSIRSTDRRMWPASRPA